MQVVWSRSLDLYIIVSASHYDIPDNNHVRHQLHLFFKERVDNWVCWQGCSSYEIDWHKKFSASPMKDANDFLMVQNSDAFFFVVSGLEICILLQSI